MPVPGGGLFPSPFLFPGDEGSSFGPFTDQLLDSFAPLLAYDTNGHLTSYLISLGRLADPIAGIVFEQGDDPQAPFAQTAAELSDGEHFMPGWGILLDPDLCPAQFLPYLAQFNGSRIPVGADEATARGIVKDESGLRRGTAPSMRATVRRYLTGTQFNVFLERAGGTPGVSVANPNNPNDWPYHMVIGFRPDESGIPAGSYTEADASTYPLIAAVEAVKPGGIQITYLSTLGFTWNEATHAWSADTFTWAAADSTQP